LAQCQWSIVDTELEINGVRTPIDISSTSIFADKVWEGQLEAWLDQDSFLADSTFNYTCFPSNIPDCRQSLAFQPVADPISVSSDQECYISANILWQFDTGMFPWCKAIEIVKDTSSITLGFRSLAAEEEADCKSKIRDTSDSIFHVVVSSSSFSFFQGARQINCQYNNSNIAGVYTDCSPDSNWIYITPRVDEVLLDTDIIVSNSSNYILPNRIQYNFTTLFVVKLGRVLLISLFLLVALLIILISRSAFNLACSYCLQTGEDISA
jgi:hypothetical protein